MNTEALESRGGREAIGVKALGIVVMEAIEAHSMLGVANRALEMVRDDSVIGLGSGRAASEFIRKLAERVRQGMRVRGVATSDKTAELAGGLGIPLLPLDAVEELDATFDGADAIDPNLNLIKGLGGAMVREKIVAAASRRLIILAGVEKLAEVLGGGYCRKLPVEVVPFGLRFVQRRLLSLGVASEPRTVGTALYLSDNGNNILDCDVSATIPDPHHLEHLLKSVPGVVDTGLFLNMVDTALIQHPEGLVKVRDRG